MSRSKADIEREADALLASSYAATLPDGHPLTNAPVEELAATAREVQQVANNVAAVHLVEDRAGSHIEVTLNAPRHKPKATQTALAMGHLFEAPVVRGQQARPGHEHADHTYRQQAQHRHYRDDRPDRDPAGSGQRPAAATGKGGKR